MLCISGFIFPICKMDMFIVPVCMYNEQEIRVHTLSLHTVEWGAKVGGTAEGTTFFFRLGYLPSFLLHPELSSFRLTGILPLVPESGRGSQQGPAVSVVCQSICEGPAAQQGLVGGCRAHSCLLGLVLKQTQ